MSIPLVKLGDICTTTQGVQITKANTSDELYDGGYRYLYIADFISDKKLSFVENKFDAKKVTEHDLVMANTGSPGRVFKGKKGILSNNLFRITFDENVVSRDYLYLILSSDIFQYQLQQQMKGGIQKHLGHKTISRQTIPLPSLEEQKKIADILDAADSLKQKDQLLVEHYERLGQSLFLDMFGDVFTNNERYKTVLFSELVEKVQIGPFGSQLHKSDYIENGIPLVNPIHIRSSKIVPNTSFTLTTKKYESLPNYHLKTGDLIMGRRGEMGRCALVTKKEDGFFCGTGSLYLRLNDKVNPSFLLRTITSKSGKNYLERNAQGVTMMNLNKKIILNIKIGLPPIELQNKFEIGINGIEKQKNIIQKSLKKSEDLFNTLLQRAFKGELTNS